ncbi:MAG TPA: sugar phosphate nucleotidyltransferase [Terriglobia bacterium]|nr:sugar phosphate nucleotidyltransferase [Terriglobia bacterium]
MHRQANLNGAWAVLLAGGEGTRLQSLTRRIAGDVRPKQFCRILGEESLLTQTRRRVDPLFEASNILAVLTKTHERFYSPELNDWPEAALIAQPENRGTGVAIALAALMLCDLDPEAMVVALPCDHHYRDEGAFRGAIEAAVAVARRSSDAIVLLGAEATYPETEYGWIEPAGTFSTVTRFANAPVRQFWEKPDRTTACDLLSRGCLWNTFVTVGRARTIIQALCEVMPNAVPMLSEGILENDLESAFRELPSIDFSRDVLSARPERLVVVRDAASGWTDLGNPHRVFETLKRQRIAPAWLESLAG